MMERADRAGMAGDGPADAERWGGQGAKPGNAERLSFRQAGAEDADVIAEIYNESVAAGDCTMDQEIKSPEDIRQQLAAFGRREKLLLLEREQPDGSRHILGWGRIQRYSSRRGYRFAAETGVFLRRSEVGRGYGSRIKQTLIDHCRELGYHHLVAKIFADNKLSIEYNKKFGYELVGIQKEIGYRHGQWQDIAILQLVLRDVPPEVADRLEES